MDKEIIERIKELINENKRDDGWTAIASFGNVLSKEGIDYKTMGYPKLNKLFEAPDLANDISVKWEDVKGLKVYYVKVENTEKNLKAVFPVFRKNSDITNWAYLGDFKKVINDLKEIAIEERWYYHDQKPNYPYPILTKYFKYTFSRLYNERKIVSKENSAAFNTGLVNELYEPIYAMFDKNKNQNRQEWHYMGFCIAGQDFLGKKLVSEFNPLPERAQYFENPDDLFYDAKSKPLLDWEHIILENVNRLPADFIEENCPKSFELKDAAQMDEDEKTMYYNQLAEAIKGDNIKFRNIKSRFAESLELAMKRVVWNYKTAIPMYYPPKDKMSLLLPLSLIDDSRIDLALVMEKTPSGNYQGHTILPLEWAYSNARLITRPDSDWLVADHIEETVDTEDE